MYSKSLSMSSLGAPSDAGASTVSLTSTAWRAQPTLIKDSNHKPKTYGSFGILVVGLGGANGSTLLAGILANRYNIEWRGPKGEPMTPNYNGCITQLPDGKDGNKNNTGIGYQNVVKGLADASMAAVGGWDIRETKLGDGLLEARRLDYDLVRQVQPEMNQIKVFRGLFDPRFVVDEDSSTQQPPQQSQFDYATHILTEQEARSDAEALKCLRADIRYFKWRNGVVGHTTVIWSASAEPNSALVTQIRTAADLLESMKMTEEERGGPLPPSLLYATAALLEGCSFVNGGSQNTLDCPGLAQLAEQQLGVYCLGTDFKAGQSKFKTAAVEYLRTSGLSPKVVIASSCNHSGSKNNSRICNPGSINQGEQELVNEWQTDGSTTYDPYTNNDSRDFGEYTSLGFLGQPLTIVTYTRTSDSVLCAPLMIDAAVWCDYFSQRSWSHEKVAKALAYLFRVPEGAAKGVDPGFFRQMEELKLQILAAHELSKSSSSRTAPNKSNMNGKMSRRVRIQEGGQTAATEWAIPGDAGVICVGLACLDRQLNSATTGRHGGEGIETFQGETSVGGGSVSMACRSMARLYQGAPIDEGYMQETPPVVSSIVPLCMIGNDDPGNKLLSLLEECGSDRRNVDTRIVRREREKRPDIRTGLSILPIYSDGSRSCFFDAASNATFSPQHVMAMFGELSSTARPSGVNARGSYGALLFGYPHLLPMMHGESLTYIFSESRKIMVDGGIVALDLNGVPAMSFPMSGEFRSVHDLKKDRVLGSALEHTDILHMNEDELSLLTGCRLHGSMEDPEFTIAKAVELFLRCGVALVAVTRGKQGSYVACSNAERFSRSPMLPKHWANCSVHIPAAEISVDATINTNGAGDSFTAGLVVAAMLRHTGVTLSGEKSFERESEIGLKTMMLASKDGNGRRNSATSATSKKVTPYTLYMKENYVSLKRQLKDDKRAIFTRCHEMWENESPDVKAMYERMARDDTDELGSNTSSVSFSDVDSSIDQNRSSHDTFELDVSGANIMNATNASLSLEAAVQFAGEIAAYHIDTTTRNRDYVDINRLLNKVISFSNHDQQEI